MARGSSYGDNSPLPPISTPPQTNIRRRATRELPAIDDEEELDTHVVPVRRTGGLTTTYYEEEHPLTRHRIWLNPFIICLVVIVLGSLVLISAALFQRPGASQLVNDTSVRSYAIQVGGSVDAFNTWENRMDR